MTDKCAIYKYVFKGQIIYIGKSDKSFEKRIYGHSKEEKFQPYLKETRIYYFYCKNPAETTIYETYLINKYKPILNKSMKYFETMGFDIPEPDWKEFKPKFEDKNSAFHGFVLIDYLMENKYIKPSLKPYSFTMQYKPEWYNSLKELNKLFKSLNNYSLMGKKLIIAIEVEAVSKTMKVFADTSFLDNDFYNNYKKLIGKAIRTYC